MGSGFILDFLVSYLCSQNQDFYVIYMQCFHTSIDFEGNTSMVELDHD